MKSEQQSLTFHVAFYSESSILTTPEKIRNPLKIFWITFNRLLKQ